MRAPYFVVVALALTATVLALAACPPKPVEPQLPPAGLAGNGATGAPLALPGAGIPVADPTGGTPSSSLPPGHPAIPGMAGTAGDPTDMGGSGAGGAGGGGALPAGHPAIDGTAPAGGATAQASAPGGDAPMLTGSVQETMDVTEYTYMRLKTSSGDTWVAVTKIPVAIGDVVTVNSSLVMNDFFSKGLNRTFPKLVMGVLVGAPKKP